jgi:hypothetical protein
MTANKFRLLFNLVVLGTIMLSVNQQAEAMPQIESPVPVEVQLFLVDLDTINDVSQNFTANFYMDATWHDPDLAHSGTGNVSHKLSDVWNPRLLILNQQRVVRTFPDNVEVSPEGTVLYRQRFWGTFSQPLELSEFPFDRQTLSIRLVTAGYDETQVQLLISETSGVSGDYSIADWEVVGYQVAIEQHSFSAHSDTLQMATLSLHVDRHDGYYLVKVVLPLIMIVIMSMLVFWIDPKLAATQISLATTSMLTLIAYRFAIGAAIPKLSFLTRLDYFTLASTILVFTSLVMVVWTSTLARHGKTERAQAVERVARWIMPTLFLAVIIETLFINILS